MGFFFKGLKNEFETAVANEPSVFEPLKVYCTMVYLPVREIIHSLKFMANPLVQTDKPWHNNSMSIFVKGTVHYAVN